LAEALPVVLLLPAALVPPDSRLHAVRLVQSKVAEATTASVLRSLVLNITGGTLSKGKLIQAYCWEAIIWVDGKWAAKY